MHKTLPYTLDSVIESNHDFTNIKYIGSSSTNKGKRGKEGEIQ